MHDWARWQRAAQSQSRVLDIGGTSAVFIEAARQSNGRITCLDQGDPVGDFDDFHRVDLDRDHLLVDIYGFDMVQLNLDSDNSGSQSVAHVDCK
jgi:hypothetical protein